MIVIRGAGKSILLAEEQRPSKVTAIFDIDKPLAFPEHGRGGPGSSFDGNRLGIVVWLYSTMMPSFGNVWEQPEMHTVPIFLLNQGEMAKSEAG